MLEQTRQRAKVRARQEADRQIEIAKEELGRLALEVLEEQFSERMKSRRRKTAAKAFVVGVAFGFLVRHLLKR